MLIRHFLSICLITVLATLVIAVARGVCADNAHLSQKQNTTHEKLTSSREDDAGADQIRLPPLQAEFLSSQGDFRFIISSWDNWESKRGHGSLVRLKNGVSEVLWERELPQEYGPRYVLVGQRGEVLMLDEWISNRSKYSIVVLNPQNDWVIQHNFEKVQKVLDVPTAEIVRKATRGSWWISEPPVLDKSGSRAYVPTTGKVLTVDLQTGELSLLIKFKNGSE